MGKPLATILATFSVEERALLAAYEAALHRAGFHATPFPCKRPRACAAEGMGGSTLGNRLGAARAFLRGSGLGGWQGLAVAQQVEVLTRSGPNEHVVGTRAFVCWLGLTGRLPFAAGLLEAWERQAPVPIRWLEHGRVAWPELIDQLISTARKLGYSQATAHATASAVTMAAAYLGRPPEAVSQDDLVRLSDALRQQRCGWRAERGQAPRSPEHQPLSPWTTGTVLHHMGLLPEPPDTHLIGRRRARQSLEERQVGFLRERWPGLHAVVSRYLAHRRPRVRPATLTYETLALGCFFRWLTSHHPEVTELRQLERRTHLEPYLRWVLDEGGPGRRRGQAHWTPATRAGHLTSLQYFFRLLGLWGWPEAPSRPLFLPGDIPRLPERLPRAFDDVEAARMVQVARHSADPLVRLIIELLAGCGLRVGEARDLQLSDVVTFGGPAEHPAAQPWLRVPLGKLGNDRYVPIGPELQAVLDAFLAAERSSREWEALPTPPAWTAYLLARKGRRVSDAYCNQVVHRVATWAGIADAHAHRWRHTFATQAINRGMDLATIATLLGHTTLDMTMVYARIANPTLRREFERVSQQVQAFYTVVGADAPASDASVTLPAGAVGPAMTVARRELEWRRLGNGWCTRRAYLDCRYELVCERCVHFNTDRLFLPVLEAQHADAVRKGQQARIELFGRLITALNSDTTASAPLPVVSGPRLADFSGPDAAPATRGLA